MANKDEPNLTEFIDIEEQILSSRIEGIRKAISHTAEKGKSVEFYTMELIRDILPAEYGLTSGFIVYEDTDGIIRLSSQLDIIIYDAAGSSPLVNLGSCKVLPLESVYGYIEVKGYLNREEIKKCIEQSNTLRSMQMRRYWRPKKGKYTETEEQVQTDSVSIRSYIFAYDLENSLKRNDNLFKYLETKLNSSGSHVFINGMCVLGNAFYRTKPKEPTAKNRNIFIEKKEDHPLLKFKFSLLEGLIRYPRNPSTFVPRIERYFPSSITEEKNTNMATMDIATGIYIETNHYLPTNAEFVMPVDDESDVCGSD